MTQRKIDPQKKREAVLLAARQLFVQKGYHTVSIPAIVKASGVSTGAIYSYFANKEELARQLYEETLSSFQGLFFERVLPCASTFEKLRAVAELTFEIAESEPEQMEYMLTMRHDEFLSDPVPLCYSEPFRWIQQIVAEGIAKGDLKEGNYILSAISFTGVILRAVELRLSGVLSTSFQEIGDELINNAWSAIRA